MGGSALHTHTAHRLSLSLSLFLFVELPIQNYDLNFWVLKDSLHIDPASGNGRRSERSIFGWRGFFSRLHRVSASNFSRLVGPRSRAEHWRTSGLLSKIRLSFSTPSCCRQRGEYSLCVCVCDSYHLCGSLHLLLFSFFCEILKRGNNSNSRSFD